MIKALLEDSAILAPEPFLLMGDFNTEPKKSDALSCSLNSGMLTDIIKEFLNYEDREPSPTYWKSCNEDETNEIPSRLDYVFTSPVNVKLIKEIREGKPFERVSTHIPVTVYIKQLSDRSTTKYLKLGKACELDDLLNQNKELDDILAGKIIQQPGTRLQK